MPGETDLQVLLRELRPKRNEGEFIFCTMESLERTAELNPLCIFREQEAVTVILPRSQAGEASLPFSFVCAWITLTVHSSLEAVGLTAAVSRALTEAGISCNVVAAYYHDHIFIPVKDAEKAMDILLSLARN